MMNKIFFHNSGFTLIELISVIMIVAILSVIAGMGLVQISNGYVFAKKNAVASQQAQVAMTRLIKELSSIQAISAATATSITYTREDTPHTFTSHTLSWTAANQPVTLDGDALMDKVQSFSLTYLNYNYATRAFTASSYAASTAMVEMKVTIHVYADIPLTFVERVVF
jgi:prepilin-type N-terminal cleavage/methylation domain-containing protein